MYIHSVSLKNYKSIGENKNVIILEPKVTTIIGKNESGKSNVLEGLSHISLLEAMNPAFNIENINRNNGTNANIEYIIVLKTTLKEQDSMNLYSDTQIVVSKDNYTATGGVMEYYNEHIRESADALISLLGNNPFKLRNQELTNYSIYISALQTNDSLHCSRINKALDFFEARLLNVNAEERDSVSSALTDLQSKWETIKYILPIVFYRKSDKILKTQYTLDEVQKELKNPTSYPNSLLADFVNLIEISNTDFFKAVSAGTDGQKTTIRNKINRNIESKINDKFHDFYTAEKVSLNADFDSNILSFSVQTSGGETLLLSERSNGLRWYLNTFIDAIAHGFSRNNVVYLFDEPGISLHINAQKELLNLFHDLADRGNQVVYTTHSPSMLDMNNDGIHRIRAVEKDEEGYTYIYKTAYDAKLSPDSQGDTLAPILSAIGMNLNDVFGPSKEKLNIVVEGVSDYIYIHTMAKKLSYDQDKFNFIPSFGATNCINICTILHGWGCPFFAIFDYDYEGVTKGGEVMRNEFLYEFEKQYCYIKSITQKDVDSHTYKKSPCVIEDIVTKEELDKFIEENGIGNIIGKTLMAKLFCDAVEGDLYSPGSQCMENFKDLLARITKAYQ